MSAPEKGADDMPSSHDTGDGAPKRPTSQQQRDTISSLSKDEESAHVYSVSKAWYSLWKSYVGLSEGSKPQLPGSLVMDLHDDDANTYIDEKIWKCWVQWYGVNPSHQLDRRNWASDDKEFEICILSPFSGIVANPTKAFDISEETGYVELQLRKMFAIALWRQSRLWACEKSRNSRFQLLLDRTQDICFQDVIDHTRSYILALEVADPDGTWPSRVPGEPKGTFEKYQGLTGQDSVCGVGYWEHELSSTMEAVFAGVSSELHETVSGVVATVKCINKSREKDVEKVKDQLQSKLSNVQSTEKSLERKVREIVKEEDSLKQEQRRLKKERAALERDRQSLEQEVNKMTSLNQITESRVQLNIGGHLYTTSTLTLTKDKDSMLAAMFSGRHSLKQESDNSYFIDRDGTHFRYILNYLRDGGFRDGALPNDTTLLSELAAEAEYYGLTNLVSLLQGIPDPRQSSSGHQNKSPYSKISKRKVANLNKS